MSEVFLDTLGEIETSLKNGCYLAALALTLTIPDICGKAEYPQENSVGKRYTEWYEENMGQYDKADEPGKVEMPYISGEIVYNLRNSFLHQGAPNITPEKIKAERCKVDKFTLTVEQENLTGSRTIEQNPNGTVTYRDLEINVVALCWQLVEVARAYYTENKDKFNFINYNLLYRI